MGEEELELSMLRAVLYTANQRAQPYIESLFSGIILLAINLKTASK